MTLKSFKQFVKKQFSYYIVLTCIKDVLSTFINILTPILLSQIIVEATAGNTKFVLFFSLAIILLKFIELIVCCVSDTKLKSNKFKNIHICKMEFYRIFFDMPIYELFHLNVGETKERFNDDFETITRKYTLSYPQTITSLFSAIVYFSYLFYLNKWIALFLFVISLVQVLPPILIQKYLQSNYLDCREVEAEITDFVIGGYKGFLIIKLYGLINWWEGKLSEYYKKYSKIGRKSIYTGTIESILNEMVGNVITYVTYGTVGLLVLNGVATFDVGIQSIAISSSVFSVIKAMLDIIKDIAISHVAEIRLFNSLATNESSEACVIKGDINVSNLTFDYGEDKLISNLNVLMNEEEIYLIKGENGCGKTTLLYLITGILKSNNGIVTIDGIPSFALAPVNFPRKVFFLPQEDAIFNFTVLELFNMMFPEGESQVLKMAKKFGLCEKTMLYSVISELSGGERKKLFLSIAFAFNPKLMVLDEPTNSLDAEGKETLKELLKQRTGCTVVVTHDSFIDDIAKHTIIIRKGAKCEHT